MNRIAGAPACAHVPLPSKASPRDRSREGSGPSFHRFSCRPCSPPENDRFTEEAAILNDLQILDLPLSALSASLPHGLDNQVPARGMALRKQAAGRIDGQ